MPDGHDTQILAWQTMIGQALQSLDTRVGAIQQQLGSTLADHGERLAKVEENARGLQVGLSEARKELKGPGKLGWTGIIIATITGLSAAVGAYFTRGHK